MAAFSFLEGRRPKHVVNRFRRRDRPQTASIELSVPEDLALFLDAIPSETTPSERRFLWQFFASIWDGAGDVLEVGPFLGGTSRAIARGMLDNPRYKGGRLLTYDKFTNYHSEETLRSFLTPLVENGMIEASFIDGLTGKSFEEVYKQLHGRFDYGSILEPRAAPLPDAPVAEGDDGDWFSMGAEAPTAFFVDGCKSWYGTLYFMRACCTKAEPGAYFLLQDYLQYTCFWLPAFIFAYPDHFRLVSHVSHTYVFQMLSCPDFSDDAYPDEPSALGADRLEDLFDAAIADAQDRKDRAAELNQNLQLVAALTYIGDKDRARARLEDIRRGPLITSRGTSRLVETVADTPTYRQGPEGAIPVRLGS